MNVAHVIVPFVCGAGGMPVAPQHIADDLVSHRLAEIGQRTRNPVIAPAGILPGHADNELLDVVVNLRSADLSARLGAIELPGDELPVPAEDRIGFCGVGDVLKRFPTPPTTCLAQRGKAWLKSCRA